MQQNKKWIQLKPYWFNNKSSGHHFQKIKLSFYSMTRLSRPLEAIPPPEAIRPLEAIHTLEADYLKHFSVAETKVFRESCDWGPVAERDRN